MTALRLGTLMLAQPSHAAACVNGVYRAGCVGPHAAVGVRNPYPRHYGYGYHGPVSCARGPYTKPIVRVAVPSIETPRL